jgi:hypothetical protein
LQRSWTLTERAFSQLASVVRRPGSLTSGPCAAMSRFVFSQLRLFPLL